MKLTEPDAVRDLADAYLLPGEDLAEIDLASVETERRSA
jgi:hypothetical protein